MKRVAFVLFFLMWLVPSLGQALPLDPLIGFLPRLPEHNDADAERVRRSGQQLVGLDQLLATFDKKIVATFRRAWQRVGDGTKTCESVVLILKMADGSYNARMPNPTNEYKSFTFPWHPATVAIVHTHPNSSRPYPEGGDLVTADKYKVPVFTLTSRGVFVYDPAVRKINKVIDGLDWLDDSAWEKLHEHGDVPVCAEP